MAYNANILLGEITKVHGFSGAVIVKLEKTFIENIPEMESVFLETEGKPVPFFIAELDYPGSDILRLKFEGYGSVENISEFIGCRVFLTSDETFDIKGNELHNFNGYKVHGSGNKTIGTVKEIVKNPGQLLLNIRNRKGEEILIPLHEDFIISLDNKRKIIKMDLPEGLTEINQG
jgi:16S rRNA processing protein RimM